MLVQLFYPLIQTVGVCIFKATLDPLSNVSSLNYLRIVSINQIATKSFWPSMITESSFEKTEHQKQIADAFTAKKSNNSSMISSNSSDSDKEQYTFDFEENLRTVAQIVGTDGSRLNMSVHSNEENQFK